jgi:hypothetical protein
MDHRMPSSAIITARETRNSAANLQNFAAAPYSPRFKSLSIKRLTSPILSRLGGGTGVGTRGCAASATTKRLYVTCCLATGAKHPHGNWQGNHALVCFDLTTDKVVWERTDLPGGDRLSISHDGKLLLIPSGWWNRNGFGLVDALTGRVMKWWGWRDRLFENRTGAKPNYGRRGPHYGTTHHAVMSRTGPIGWVAEQQSNRIFCSNGDYWDANGKYLGHWKSETGERMWGCKFCEVHFQGNEVVWAGQCYGNGC